MFEGVNYVYFKGVIVGCLIIDGDMKVLLEVCIYGFEEVCGIIEGMFDLGYWVKNLGGKLKEFNDNFGELKGLLLMKLQNMLWF